jgi:FKBP-type peptidyl-prolyl cis-trans isomerase
MRYGFYCIFLLGLVFTFLACKEDTPVQPDPMAEANAYLAENAKKDGVITTDTGLQFKVLLEGEGVKPTASDSVVVHYIGKLADGSEFGNTYKKGNPSTFLVSQLIGGWVEGLQLMNVGSKYELVVPPKLGYGASGSGYSIPPYSVLIFELELLEIL